MRAQDLTCCNSNNNNNNNIYNSYFEQATLLDTSFFAITEAWDYRDSVTWPKLLASKWKSWDSNQEGIHEKWEKTEFSLPLEFCIFRKIENTMLRVRAGVQGQGHVRSGKRLGQPWWKRIWEEDMTALPAWLCLGLQCSPIPVTGLMYGILFYSLRTRKEKRGLEQIQEPELTHMSWRKFKWEIREWWQAVLLRLTAGSRLGKESG